jgi:hypothetical protein
LKKCVTSSTALGSGAKNPALTDDSVAAFCSRVQHVAHRIDPVPASFTLARDPNDKPESSFDANMGDLQAGFSDRTRRSSCGNLLRYAIEDRFNATDNPSY